MQKHEDFPMWFVWLWEKGILAFMLVILLGSLLIMGGVYVLDRRLGQIQQSLIHQPPRQYEPPDLASRAAQGVDLATLTSGELVYVPIYSHVYHGDGRPYPLEAILSVRNVDVNHQVFLRSIRYFDTGGQLKKTFVDQLVLLNPLETLEFLVPEHDASGGSGANFLVDWRSVGDAQPPMIGAVMVGVSGPQAVAFTTQGRALGQPED